MGIVVGLFQNQEETKRAVSTLNRHRFVGKDIVKVVDQARVSPEDSVGEQESTELETTLATLGLPAERSGVYAGRLKQGHKLVIVRTDEERAPEALNIIRQAGGTGELISDSS